MHVGQLYIANKPNIEPSLIMIVDLGDIFVCARALSTGSLGTYTYRYLRNNYWRLA